MITNDNQCALRLYQRAGFRLHELRADTVEEARRLKPSIPQAGNDGIPIHDELDLVRPLEPSDRSPHDEQRHIAVLWVAERFRDPPHDLNPSDIHIATAGALVSATALKWMARKPLRRAQAITSSPRPADAPAGERGVDHEAG